ncbi:MAG: hypothetical protein WA728_32900 [Xanthobacteraceae bacterium]
MSEVHKVTVELNRPSKRYPSGRVAYGYFTYVDGTVTMTDAKGTPADDGNGRRYVQRDVKPGFERGIACNLTRQLREALRGPSGLGADFSGPINYPFPRWKGV